jgi:hypothetical protein
VSSVREVVDIASEVVVTLAGEGFSRQLGDEHLCGLTGPNAGRLGLRDAHIDRAALRSGRGGKSSRVPPLLMRSPIVDVAHRDDAGERREDALEALGFLEPVDVGAFGFDGRDIDGDSGRIFQSAFLVSRRSCWRAAIASGRR